MQILWKPHGLARANLRRRQLDGAAFLGALLRRSSLSGPAKTQQPNGRKTTAPRCGPTANRLSHRAVASTGLDPAHAHMPKGSGERNKGGWVGPATYCSGVEQDPHHPPCDSAPALHRRSAGACAPLKPETRMRQ